TDLLVFIVDLVCIVVGLVQIRILNRARKYTPLPLYMTIATFLALCTTILVLCITVPNANCAFPFGETVAAVYLLVFLVEASHGCVSTTLRVCINCTVVISGLLAGVLLLLNERVRETWACHVDYYATPSAVGMVILCIVMWRYSIRDEAAMAVQAHHMARAMQAALGMFYSSLPRRTRRYVTDAIPSAKGTSEPVLETMTPLEAVGATFSRVGEAEGEGGYHAHTPGSTGERERLVHLREASHPHPLSANLSISNLSISRLHSISNSYSHEMALRQSPGMITTEDECVIAFVGVVQSAHRVPAVAYIKDLVTLMRALDRVICVTPGVEKVKGIEGALIVRIGAGTKVPERTGEGEGEGEAWSGDEDHGSGEDLDRRMLRFHCRQMIRFSTLCIMAVHVLKGMGHPLETIEGVRTGIACGSVTAGVLGTCELMFDVFGDTVNTAARLMHKASPSETLVTEEVASLGCNITDYRGCPYPRHKQIEYVQSEPIVMHIKGKGLCPVRKICHSPRLIHHSARHCQVHMEDAFRDLKTHTCWTDWIMTADSFHGTIRGYGRWNDAADRREREGDDMGDREGERDAEERSVHSHVTGDQGSDVAEVETPPTVDRMSSSILPVPWDVINASFESPPHPSNLDPIPVTSRCNSSCSSSSPTTPSKDTRPHREAYIDLYTPPLLPMHLGRGDASETSDTASSDMDVPHLMVNRAHSLSHSLSQRGSVGMQHVTRGRGVPELTQSLLPRTRSTILQRMHSLSALQPAMPESVPARPKRLAFNFSLPVPALLRSFSSPGIEGVSPLAINRLDSMIDSVGRDPSHTQISTDVYRECDDTASEPTLTPPRSECSEDGDQCLTPIGQRTAGLRMQSAPTLVSLRGSPFADTAPLSPEDRDALLAAVPDTLDNHTRSTIHLDMACMDRGGCDTDSEGYSSEGYSDHGRRCNNESVPMGHADSESGWEESTSVVVSRRVRERERERETKGDTVTFDCIPEDVSAPIVHEEYPSGMAMYPEEGGKGDTPGTSAQSVPKQIPCQAPPPSTVAASPYAQDRQPSAPTHPSKIQDMESILLEHLEAMYVSVAVDTPLHRLVSLTRRHAYGTPIKTIKGRRGREREALSNREVLGDVCQAIPQIIKLVLDKASRRNLFGIFHSVKKLKTHMWTVLFMSIFQICVIIPTLDPDYQRELYELANGNTRLLSLLDVYLVAKWAYFFVMALRLVVYTYALAKCRQFAFRVMKKVMGFMYRDASEAEGDTDTESNGMKGQVIKSVPLFTFVIVNMRVILQMCVGVADLTCVLCLLLMRMEVSNSNVITPYLNNLTWIFRNLGTNEAFLSMFGVSAVDSVPTLLLQLMVGIPLSCFVVTVFKQSSFLHLTHTSVCLYALLQSVMQVVYMYAGVFFMSEAVAAKVLVSRVASGRFFNRLLTPVAAQTSGLFAAGGVSPHQAASLVRTLEEKHMATQLEDSMLSSLFYDQIKIKAAPVLSSVRHRHTPETQHTESFMNSMYSRGRQREASAMCQPSDTCTPATPSTLEDTSAQGVDDAAIVVHTRQLTSLLRSWYPTLFPAPTPEPGIAPVHSMQRLPSIAGLSLLDRRVSCRVEDLVTTSYTSDADTEPRRVDPPSPPPAHIPPGVDVSVPVNYASEEEISDMRQAEIEFFPLMVYTKLDICGFTKYCTDHGSEVVPLLNLLFTALDEVLAKYSASGIIKVKTIGDAYEAMLPFSPTHLKCASVSSIIEGVAAMAKAASEFQSVALRIFSSLQVDLSVRCGVGMGPAFAAVLGRIRVSYDVVGRAPSTARTMEGLSPLGCVTVSLPVYELLCTDPTLHFGSYVTPMTNTQNIEDRASSALLDTASEMVRERVAAQRQGDSDFEATLLLNHAVLRSVSGSNGGTPPTVTEWFERDHLTALPLLHMHEREGSMDKGTVGVVLEGVSL
ncbi:hypothetical protein KIPB_003978, partial [Kipferlia bialata]